ncbi:MAG: AIR synthase family protein [Salinigranum sp.]
MIGKVAPDDLASLVFSRTGAEDDDVLMGPKYGEDTAAVRIGGQVLVVNTDPISLAVERIGTLGVHVACNDVAASGGRPRWLTMAVFLPGESADPLDAITAQVDEAARELGVAVVGGHSEYAPERSRPMLVLTCLGLADEYVPTGGVEPGDRIVLTKGAGIEGTAILATDFRDRLAGDVDAAVFDRAAAFYEEVSVVVDAEAVGPYAHAMHDPTEGGLTDGLLEMAVASGCSLEVDREAVPVREETATLCAAAGVDPLRIFGSGGLLAAVAADDLEAALAALGERGIDAAPIATAREADGDPAVIADGERRTEPGRDDLYALWE